jgi:hypothetical protein
MNDFTEDLRALRARLEKLRRLHQERSAVAEADRELLAKKSTYPRRRREVEEEFQAAAVFDLPMLVGEIAKAERGIAELEAELQGTVYGSIPVLVIEQGAS